MPKKVFFSPFPRLDDKTYNKVSDLSIGQEIIIGGLPTMFDRSADSSDLEEYKNHCRDLDRWVVTQIKVLEKKSIEKGEMKPEVSYLPYPKSEGAVSFSEFKADDLLMIHSHGNTKVIGTGGFILTPELLARNLDSLNLPKLNPPTLVIWSCKSGKGGMESYAEMVANIMTKMGYRRLDVLGIDANIHTDVAFGKITYFRAHSPVRARRSKKPIFEEVSPGSAVKHFHSTPIPEIEGKKLGGVLTTHKILKSLRMRDASSSEESTVSSSSSSDTTRRSSRQAEKKRMLKKRQRKEPKKTSPSSPRTARDLSSSSETTQPRRSKRLLKKAKQTEERKSKSVIGHSTIDLPTSTPRPR